MVLKPQDILIMLKIVALGKEEARAWSYASLAADLCMSPSEVHAGIKRAVAGRLAVKSQDRVVPSLSGLEEFLVHGIQYVFVPERGEVTRGVPTGFAAPPLNEFIVPSDELPPVWPYAEGAVRGVSFSPLYKSVPRAVQQDKELYELLVLVDAIRAGRARERAFAVKELRKRLQAK